ncbi:hypothetical protein BH10BAC3_BH10BAC3_16120 [soil metagenome]
MELLYAFMALLLVIFFYYLLNSINEHLKRMRSYAYMQTVLLKMLLAKEGVEINLDELLESANRKS